MMIWINMHMLCFIYIYIWNERSYSEVRKWESEKVRKKERKKERRGRERKEKEGERKGERERKERKKERLREERERENRERKFRAKIQRDHSPLQILLVCSVSFNQ